MKKTLVTSAVVIVVIVAGAVLIAPYFIGRSVEARFRQRIAVIADRTDVPIHITAYHRHWFSATAATAAGFHGRRIVLRYQIRHGPLPDFDLATIRTRTTAADLPIARNGDTPFVQARTRVGFTGDSLTSIRVAPLTWDATAPDGKPLHIAWQGMHGRLKTSDRQHLTLVSPGFKAHHAGVTSGARGLRLTASSADWGDAAPADLTARDLEGESRLHVDQVFIHDPENQKDLRFGGTLDTQSTSARPNRWGVHAALKLDHIELPAESSAASALDVQRFELDAGLDGLNAKRLIALLTAIKPYQRRLAKADKRRMRHISARMNALLLRRLPDVLTDDSAMHLGIPTLATRRGAAGLDITASLRPPAPPQSNTGQATGHGLALLRRAVLAATVHVDKPLLGWMLKQGGHPQRDERALTGLRRNGLIEVSGDTLRSSLHLDADRLAVNGHVLPDRVRRALLLGIMMAGQSRGAAAGSPAVP